MRTKQEYQEALNCITGMTRNEFDNPTPDFAKKYLESDKLLQELIDNINKVVSIFEEEHGDMSPHRATEIYSSDYWRIRKILIKETDNLKENE